jgi:two-component system, OmpR family, sensor histidine kinase ChvG
MTQHGSAISRRLMAAFFLVTMVPILGWSVVVDLSEHLLHLESVESLEQAAAQAQDAVASAHRSLVGVLALSLLSFAGALFYLRKTLVTPLESLAARAREASVRWKTPQECQRIDEIGDLARALDESVRELQQRAERAMLFAADLSHELRTPLSAIKGAAEFLTQQTLSADEALRFSQNIAQESERLERLVTGILELERGARAAPGPEAPSELGGSIARVIDALAPLWQRKALRVVRHVPDGPAWSRVGEDRHERVLFVLLENAIKFSPTDETIEVSLGREGEQHVVTVMDRGPGVPAAKREAVFERYARARSEHAARGTGLGLAIAKALVSGWGGTISVDDASGGGACFRYSIPSADLRGEHS